MDVVVECALEVCLYLQEVDGKMGGVVLPAWNFCYPIGMLKWDQMVWFA